MYLENDRGRKVINDIEELATKEKYVGRGRWANLKDDVDVFEISDGNNKIWCSFIEQNKSGENVPNRKSIYMGVPAADNSISQIMELCVPYEFSKRYNARVCENQCEIDLRMYGKFKDGRKTYKPEIFMNYLKDNGHANEVRVDKEGNEYVKILSIEKDLGLNLDDIKVRFNKWANVVKEYKDYYISLFS